MTSMCTVCKLRHSHIGHIMILLHCCCIYCFLLSMVDSTLAWFIGFLVHWWSYSRIALSL